MQVPPHHCHCIVAVSAFERINRGKRGGGGKETERRKGDTKRELKGRESGEKERRKRKEPVFSP